ncbi:MAG: DNA-directed RNA polymerase subunit B'', partial [Candidatus Methanomethylophilaceae archaeon]|nr:DNA-directed RNA polymerase subunit B'' [Candidatus Methanomethylophilaceae archaeon]
DLPMMVRSKGCNLNKQVLERHLERSLSQAEYEEELIKQKEDPREPGGYFIIGGTERVLITLEDLAPNRVMVEYNEKYGAAVEVAKVFSQKDGYRALTLVEKKKDGMVTVSVPVASGSIPLVALMKALGMESDAEIFETIVSDDAMANIVYANIESAFDKKTYAPNGYHTKEDAILFLERNFAAGQAKEYRTKKVESILDRSLLPHLGDTEADRMKKAIFLGRVARSVLELSLGKRKEDDKDHYANKRLKLSGDLMGDLFRTSFSSLMKDLKYQLERNWGRKKSDLNIASSIRPDLLTHKLLHALATGNWVGGRAGVSQLLDRTSNRSAMSHLRRGTSSLTRSQPHFEARDLHPTQWGRLCPSETPEGQNCGLVKNAALIIDVSEGFSEQDIKWMLRELDIESVKSGNGTRVFVNGDLVGIHSDVNKLVNEIRERRRCGLISNEINIRYDEEMDEVIINSDEGRLRRPLLIVKNGRLCLSRKHIEGIREGKIRWQDLFREGIIEWLDA